MISRLILFLNLFGLFYQTNTQLHGVKDVEVYGKLQFRNMTEESVYNKHAPPPVDQSPVKVMANIVLYSFGSIEETEASYSIQLLIRLGWTDRRLIFKANGNDTTVFRIDGNSWHVTRIWTPAIHLPNNKQPKTLQSTGNEPILAHIYSNGTVLISKRVLLTGFCDMDFKLYPLDIQYCDIQIESFALSKDALILEWIENAPLDINDDFSWSGFKLTNITLSNTTKQYSEILGRFSKLMATFTLKREFGHFILVVYLPSMMFVVTSWISFWLEIPAAPARVTLGLTSLLTLVTNSKVSREELPAISYVHALDVWILLCVVYVFASLIEYAIVNFIYNTEKRAKKHSNSIHKDHGISNKTLSISRNNSFLSVDNHCDLFYNASQRNSHTGHTNNAHSHTAHSHLNAINHTSQHFRGAANSHYGAKITAPKVNNADCVSIATNMSKLDSVSVAPVNACPKDKTDPQDFANSIDRKCRLIFPLSFLLLNAIYWTTLALLAHYSTKKTY